MSQDIEGSSQIREPWALKKFFAENPEVERYYNEFRDDGGKTGWSYAKPLDRIAADLQSKSSEKSKMQNLFGRQRSFLGC